MLCKVPLCELASFWRVWIRFVFVIIFESFVFKFCCRHQFLEGNKMAKKMDSVHCLLNPEAICFPVKHKVIQLFFYIYIYLLFLLFWFSHIFAYTFLQQSWFCVNYPGGPDFKIPTFSMAHLRAWFGKQKACPQPATCLSLWACYLMNHQIQLVLALLPPIVPESVTVCQQTENNPNQTVVFLFFPVPQQTNLALGLG